MSEVVRPAPHVAPGAPEDATEPYDIALRDAWYEFCDGLKDRLELVFRDAAPGTELDRATGVRYLARYIPKALNDVLEYLDFDFPQLWLMQHPTSKSFGDNPDCSYLAARIDGSRNYRITGNRGTANWLRFVLTPYEEIVGGSALVGAKVISLPGDQLQAEYDGSFVLAVGPDPQRGNWIETDPDILYRLMIRQFFGEWDKERPTTARIERVGQEGEVPARLTAQRMVTALRDVNDYIAKDSDRWYRWSSFYKQHPNTFYKGRPDVAPFGSTAAAERTVGRWLNICFWSLAPEEALLVEFTAPDSYMWLIELNNFWLTSVDYRFHFSSVNSTQAAVDPDGVIRVVVANADPGIPNWLDPAGHLEGLISARWIDPAPDAENVTPAARVVVLADLQTRLPADARRITREGRLEQLRRLQAGVENRFSPLR